MPITDEQILAELEDVIRTAPTSLEIRQGTPETNAWLGRALAVVEMWNLAKGFAASAALTKIQAARTPMDIGQGYSALMVLLHQGRHNYRMATIGPVSVAVGHGLVFDYFDSLRKEIQTAQQDLLFVDPYLDADFVRRICPKLKRMCRFGCLGDSTSLPLCLLQSYFDNRATTGSRCDRLAAFTIGLSLSIAHAAYSPGLRSRTARGQARPRLPKSPMLLPQSGRHTRPFGKTQRSNCRHEFEPSAIARRFFDFLFMMRLPSDSATRASSWVSVA